MNMMNQKNNYQLLSLDMDGTLLNSAKQIPCETTAAIQELMERGVEVVVGTGRGLAELADYRNAFQGMHYGLLVSGGGKLVPLGQTDRSAAFLVGGEILVADGAGGLGGAPVQIRAGAGKTGFHIRVGGVELGEESGRVAGAGRGKAGGHHRAAYLLALVSEIVDVVVEGNRPDHQHVVVFAHVVPPVCFRVVSDNDHRMAKSSENSIDFAAKRQVWQRMILKIIHPMFTAMRI